MKWADDWADDFGVASADDSSFKPNRSWKQSFVGNFAQFKKIITPQFQLAVDQYVDHIVETAETIVRTSPTLDRKEWLKLGQRHPDLTTDFKKALEVYIERIIETAGGIVKRTDPFNLEGGGGTFMFSSEVKPKKNNTKPKKPQHKPGVYVKGTKIQRFLYFNNGEPVFLDNQGNEVHNNLEKFIPKLKMPPGSCYEMAKIRLTCNRIVNKLEEGSLRNSKACKIWSNSKKATQNLQKRLLFSPFTVGVDGDVRNFLSDRGQQEPNEEEDVYAVLEMGVKVGQKKQQPNAYQKEDMYFADKKNKLKMQNAMVHVPASTLPTTPKERQQYEEEKKKKQAKKKQKICRPVICYPSLLVNTDPKQATTKPQQGNNTKTLANSKRTMKDVKADRMFNPGVKVNRPVRGFRTVYLNRRHGKLESKSVREGDLNPENLANCHSYGDINPNLQIRSKSAVHPFYEPLQLLCKAEVELHELRQAGMTDDKQMRKPLNVKTVSVPKRGRIKLTALPYELADPEYFDDRMKAEPTSRPERHHNLRHQAKFKICLPLLCFLGVSV